MLLQPVHAGGLLFGCRGSNRLVVSESQPYPVLAAVVRRSRSAVSSARSSSDCRSASGTANVLSQPTTASRMSRMSSIMLTSLPATRDVSRKPPVASDQAARASRVDNAHQHDCQRIRQVADRADRPVMDRRIEHDRPRADRQGEAAGQLERGPRRPRDRAEHEPAAAEERRLGGSKAGNFLAAHRMAADGIEPFRQPRHGAWDNLLLGAAEVHDQCAGARVAADLRQQTQDRAHRRRQQHNIRRRDARSQVRRTSVNGARRLAPWPALRRREFHPSAVQPSRASRSASASDPPPSAETDDTDGQCIFCHFCPG